MDEQKIKEVFSDEKFVRELLDMDEPEQVQQALHERGVDISREEILATRDALIKAAENGGRLSDKELAETAGGIGAIMSVADAFLFYGSIVVGAGLGTGLGFAASGRW